jgi:peptide deformylase
LKRIRQIGDPILREVSIEVDEAQVRSTGIIKLIIRMQEILNGIKSISDENGNALSAPQVGCLVRVILLRIDDEFLTMINPEFSPQSDETFEFEEECFSLYDQRATLKRYYRGTVTYLDESGVRRSQQLCGEQSGLVQHEIDHLDGVLFLDRLEQQGRQVESIYDLLDRQPARLAQVQNMIAYMTGSV